MTLPSGAPSDQPETAAVHASMAAEPASEAPAPAPAKPKRSAATAVLAVLTVLSLLAAAGLGVLFMNARDDANQQLAARDTQIEKLEDDLKAKTSELDRVNGDLDSANTCLKAVKDFFDALGRDDDAGAEKAILAIDKQCEDVDPI